MSKKLISGNDALQTNQNPLENIENLILNIRGNQVMLDRDLAHLYGVETKVLNQAVKRNLERFPEDFMFQLTKDEANETLFSRSQFVTLKITRGENIKYLPFAIGHQIGDLLGITSKSQRVVGQLGITSRRRRFCLHTNS